MGKEGAGSFLHTTLLPRAISGHVRSNQIINPLNETSQCALGMHEQFISFVKRNAVVQAMVGRAGIAMETSHSLTEHLRCA